MWLPDVQLQGHPRKHASRKIVGVNIKEERGQNRSLMYAILEASLPASPTTTSIKGEASVVNQLSDHTNHVPVWNQAKQVAGEATMHSMS